MKAFRCLAVSALLLAALANAGCAHRSSSRIVEGDGSNIKFISREAAGGRVGGG